MSAVLVVDDDDDLRDIMALALARLGRRAVQAANGAEALTRLDEDEDQALALIFLDLRMPVLDGAGFVDALDARGRPRPIIVVMTAVVDAELSALSVDADAWLPKPFELHDVAVLLERLI